MFASRANTSPNAAPAVLTRVCGMCLRTRAGGIQQGSALGQFTQTEKSSECRSRGSQAPTRGPDARTSTVTDASWRDSPAPGLGVWAAPPPLLRHGTPPPPPPSLVRASAALTPLQPHRFPQRRHLLPLPTDPQEMTTEGLR